jgi:uncharacterized Fe-S cluster protein YjdI
MGDGELSKEYSNGELTVIWKPRKCIHSEVCVKTLPRVYHPGKKPWIVPGNASTADLMAQIDKCPSGALSYRLEGQDAAQNKEVGSRVEVLPKGPLLVHGNLDVVLADGSVDRKDKSTAFCRCGASANKPYCDGTHRKIGFEG